MRAFNPAQPSLWDAPQPGLFHVLPMPGADVRYAPAFLTHAEAQDLFTTLFMHQPWRQGRRRMYERDLDVPRLQVWYREPERPWPAELLPLRAKVEAAVNERFDAVLLNLYRNGQDSVAWHSDNEVPAGPQPTIASLTLGAVRRFMFRPKPSEDDLPRQTLALDLPPGSLLIMGPGTQEHWEHQVPKTARPVGPRINLTFRVR